jgi:hypothetical protein
MDSYRNKLLIFLLFFAFICYNGKGQAPELYKKVAANEEFERKSRSYRKLWGENRRKEWATTLTVPVLYLDSAYGGLVPQKTGGGNETKSLQLRSVSGKEYSLRSVNKSRDDVIPPGFEKTFLEDIIRDGVSQSHPYASLALAGMQEAAGIYHPVPQLFYLPSQPALDSFNSRYGNDLYFLEQRPDGDWSEAANLGYFKEFTDTENVLEALKENNLNGADQAAFIKARLFDMLIGDWDRHEGNWKWGIRRADAAQLFVPIPRDRDQAFYTHNGILIDRFLPLSGLSFMQHFDHFTKNINPLNKAAKSMDRFFTNALTQADWVKAAKELQLALTDKVIEESLKQMPAELFAVSGEELVAKLKSRRKSLVQYATSYYEEVAREVEVTGSSRKEFFHVAGHQDGDVSVSVYRYNSRDEREEIPFYSRTFKPRETREIRIFGIGGEDVFLSEITGGPIKVSIIGGPGKDSITQRGKRIHIYDGPENTIQAESARLHLSQDSSIHEHEYKVRAHHANGVSAIALYNNKDRFFVGLRYTYQGNKWRKGGLPLQHMFGVNYSFSQNALSASYDALRPAKKGKPSLFLHTEYDALRWTNFYGMGNETKAAVDHIQYYKMLSREWLASLGARHTFGKNNLELFTFFQHSDIENDTGKFVTNIFQSIHPEVTVPNDYAGLGLAYNYISLNNAIVPTRGFVLQTNGKLVRNTRQKDFFQNYSLSARAYLPIAGKFSIAVNAGGETFVSNAASASGNAQPLQHAIIGGPASLRGYRLERFWGTSSFYNNNEIRFITNLRTYLLNAKIGLIAFFDDGRVWMKGERSGTLHTAYGTGLLLAPFNKLCVQVTYGISGESSLLQLKLNSRL